MIQSDLFGMTAPPALEGLRFLPEALTRAEEAEALKSIAGVDFAPFQFHGFLGKRRVASFGWRYDYNGGGLIKAAPMPDFVIRLRERVAECADLDPAAFVQALVTEYAPGAGIGWHRDKAHFGKVAALSFAAPCVLRFRRRTADGWDRQRLSVPPRAFYLLDGPARQVWEHSIAPLDQLRYSITFRTKARADA